MKATLKKLPNVSGVAPNSTATVSVPVGAKEIEDIGLEMAGTTITESLFSNFEFKVDGVTLQAFKTSAHMKAIRAYYGQQNIADEQVLSFFRDYLQNASQSAAFNVGLGDVQVCQLSFDIGAASSDVTVTAYERAVQRQIKGLSARDANKLGVFTRVRNFVYTLSGAGETEIDNIPKQGFLQAMHLMASSNVITNAELWIGEEKIWDATRARMISVVEAAGRTRQTNAYHIDMMLRNELGREVLLDGVSDYRLKIAHSGAATITLYHETLDSWRGE